METETQKIDAQKSAIDAMTPDIHIPGYKIIRELGHGGMAYVYLAVQESFGREVALKILSPQLADDDQFSKRFLREARIVSQLNHPNIVTVFDAGKQGKYHYMSMEYIPGKDVKQLKDSISHKDAIRIVKDVASALDFAGDKGIVHRDVKPENIMIHQSDRRVILMDFGIAHGDDVTHGMTQTGKAIGTPHFMSPEQTKGLKVDHRSDIYSLGVVLYQLLARHLPFDASSAVAVGIKHLTAPIPLLPTGLEIFQPIVNMSLSKQPEHRYQKASELITALNKISDSQIESISSNANEFRQSGADHNAETQISDVPAKKQKMPDLVFPSSNNKTIYDEKPTPSTRRRNLLLLLLLTAVSWAGIEKQNELTQFWAYQALPEVVKIFPDLFPKSYLQYWADKKQFKNNRQQKVSNVTTSQPALLEDNTTNTAPIEYSNVSTAIKPDQPTTQASPIIEKDKATILKENLTIEPENAIELASIYRNILLSDKKNTNAIRELKELREWNLQQIGLAFAAEDTDKARQYINIMKQSFPRATSNKRFIRLEKKVTFLEKINEHFTNAEKYFKSGALTKPLNKNALNEIRTVLQLSPNNEDAKKFINKIVQAFIDKTDQLKQQGNLHNAVLMVEEGLAALSKNTRLLAKRKELKNLKKHNKDIIALLSKAKKHELSDNLITPQAYNAYDVYQQVLKKEKDNLQAKAGLKNIHQLLAKKITAGINKGNLEISAKYLQAAIQRYGKSPLLASVQLKLNDALAEEAPKIETLKLSTRLLSNLIDTGAVNTKVDILKLQRTLYVGFNYINFDPKSTWLDVVLTDNTRKVILFQKPVVISTQLGEHFFDITLPNTTFKNGRYKLELKLDNKILKAKTFLVKN